MRLEWETHREHTGASPVEVEASTSASDRPADTNS